MTESKGRAHTPWQSEVQSHYSEHRLSDIEETHLKNLLLKTHISSAAVDPASEWTRLRQKLIFGLKLPRLRWIFSHATTALCSAVATIAMLHYPKDSVDLSEPLFELVSGVGHRLPADFDLEGDSEALPQVVGEFFPQNANFPNKIPVNILQKYSPSEGRFVSLSGMPGIIIQLTPKISTAQVGLTQRKNATLYMFRLSAKNSPKFPNKKTVKQFQRDTNAELEKINAWRDNEMGYALISPLAAAESFGNTEDLY